MQWDVLGEKVIRFLNKKCVGKTGALLFPLLASCQYVLFAEIISRGIKQTNLSEL